MTIAVQDNPTTPFKAVHAIFNKATLARQCNLAEADQEAVEGLIAPLFEAVLSAPVMSLGDVAAKAEAIVSEYGDANCIPTHMVETLITDLRGLAGSSVVD